MKRIWLAMTIVTLCSSPAHAGTLGFLETFSLSKDKKLALKQLLPGTKNYYYYHALSLQNNGQLKKVEQLLKTWRSRHRYDSRRTEIEYRQALLLYQTQPKRTLRFLRKKLYLYFRHSRVIRGKKRKYPSQIKASAYSWKTMLKRAMKSNSYSLYGFENSAIERLAQNTVLNGRRTRQLLKRLQRPDLPNILSLIYRDLGYKHSQGFGSLSIHRKLMLSQLLLLAKEKPSLRNNSRFIKTYIKKLIPSNDAPWKTNAKVKRAYLNRLWSFVKGLQVNQNSLKLHVLNQLLKLDRSEGIYNAKHFLRYIKIPRYAPYVNRDFVKQHRYHTANRYSYYSTTTGLPRVGNDEPLIRKFLQHFFVTAKDYKAYSTYIKPKYLKRIFAKTKLLNGIGNAENWYNLLPPSTYKALKERIDLDFVATNKIYFGPKEPVRLSLRIKNVKTLLVKVYRINAFNYYRKHKRRVGTGMNLDGLVANSEKIYKYTDAPILRTKRTFSFPALSKRGVYIIDFIGNGKSSRALIRKGMLRHLIKMTAAGQSFTIIDEARNVLKNTTLWMAGKTYKAGKDGHIRLPFTNRPRKQSIILGHKGFVTLASFHHAAERYHFSAGFHVDRESLLTRKKATLLVRASLLIGNQLTTTKIIKSSVLTIVSTDRFGIRTTKTVSSFKLHNDKESTYTFTVPKNLYKVSFSLTIRIKNLSTGKLQSFTKHSSFTINTIDKQRRFHAFHLRKIKGQYTLYLLDKTGVPKAFHSVHIRMKHKHFRSVRRFSSLQTDAKGQISLGHLHGISWIYARSYGSMGVSKKWHLQQAARNLPSTLQGKAGTALFVPYIGTATKVTRAAFSLLEVRKGRLTKDHFASLKLKDGFLSFSDLPAGDYSLRIKEFGHDIKIRLTEGKEKEDYILGKHRLLQTRKLPHLHITNVQATKKNITIQIANATPLARVHVIATRYVPTFSLYANLGNHSSESLRNMTLFPIRSRYQIGRKIGDEYRYILERRYARKYPGNMLKRPSLLLNPWAVRKTQTGRQTASTGSAFGGRGYGGRGFGGGGFGRGRIGRSSQYSFANLDFLPTHSVVLSNLRVDKNGQVVVSLKKLGAHQHIHIIAVDPFNTIYKQLSLNDTPVKFRDLRLLSALSPKKHYAQKRQVTMIGKGKSFAIQDITSAKFDTYDSLARLHALFSTLRPNKHLSTFRFILRWPKLTEKQKRTYYSKYACHELNFFLYKKDTDFFIKVVLSSLKNKKDKTFMDHYLLGVDLVRYLQPWAFAQLNVVERILLGQRFKTQRSKLARYIKERNDLRRPNIRYLNRLFDTALKTSSLDGRGKFKGYFSALLKSNHAKADAAKKEMHARSRLRGSGARELAMPSPAAPPARNIPAMKKMAQPRRSRRFRRYKRKRYKRKSRSGRLLDSMNKTLTLRRRMRRQYYRKLEKTQEWAENNYYKLTLRQQNASLIKINDFWRDYSKFSGFGNFTSEHIAQASRNFTEIMFALSVTDLPFKSSAHKYTFKRAKMTITAGNPMLLFHKQILAAKAPKHKSSILVSQHYFRYGARYKYVNGRRTDRYVRDEFLIHTIYGAQVVVTNPSSSRQKLDLLLQIPQGALPVANGRRTKSIHMYLSSYRTRRFTYYFYFPKQGAFTHFPAHVSSQGKLVSWTQSSIMRVVEQPTNIDKKTWSYISQNGTQKEVVHYLNTHNIFRVKLAKIAWRMKDKSFYKTLKALLQNRHRYDMTLASYSIKHNDADGIREYLQHKGRFLRRCGAYLQSGLVTIDPVIRKTHEHLAYSPLVNARAHQLGKRRKIVNNRLFSQYRRLMNILKYKAKLDNRDKMAVVYYLLLQNRVYEAIQFFKQVKRNKLQMKLQYDYFASYIAFYTADLKLARATASKYKNYPVLRWRNKFLNVLNQLNEIEGKGSKVVDPKDRTQRQTQLARTEASFQFKVESRKVTLSHRNIKAFRVNYYLMDIELLFSKNPFLKKQSGQFSYIQPNHSRLISIAKDSKGKTIFALPKKYRSSNVMIEILAAGIRKSKAYYANTLDVQISRQYGQLRVSHETTQKGLRQVYVKVYAKMKNGNVRFYKDGYTDLRGRFDYSSLSTNDLDNVKRFSILVLSKKNGAIVREAAPPKQ